MPPHRWFSTTLAAVIAAGCPPENGDDDACLQPDPAVSAAFSVTLDAWPDAPGDDHDIDVPCTIDAVALDAGDVVTTLTCDVAGAPRTATLRVAASPAGEVAWTAGSAVQLRSYRYTDDTFGEQARVVHMTADDVVHVVGVEAGDPGDEWYAPFTVAAEFPCGEERGDIAGEVLPFRLEISHGDDAVAILHAHRDVLAIDDDQQFAIDVGQAETNFCCHYTRGHQVLIRRVHAP